MDEDKDQQEVLEREEVAEINPELEAALKEAQDNLNGWKRASADFENYKRRKEAENQELVEFAREVAVTKLLPTLDSLTQGLLHAPKENSQTLADDYIKWKVGLLGVVQQLDKALAELGVKKIVAKGKKFDPNFHEAVREVPGEEDGVVVEELMGGFEINGKVIRPSQVVISKKKDE